MKNIRLLLCFVFLAFLAGSCDKEKSLPEPIKDLVARMNQTSCECLPFIDKYETSNKVFYLSSCRGPACLCMVTLYDENGKVMTMKDNDELKKLMERSKKIETVASCEVKTAG